MEGVLELCYRLSLGERSSYDSKRLIPFCEANSSLGLTGAVVHQPGLSVSPGHHTEARQHAREAPATPYLHLSLLPTRTRTCSSCPSHRVLCPDPDSQYSTLLSLSLASCPPPGHDGPTAPSGQALPSLASLPSPPPIHGALRGTEQGSPAHHSSYEESAIQMAACLQVQSWWVLVLSPRRPPPSCFPGHHPVTHSQATGRNHSTTVPDKGLLCHLSSLREVAGSGGGM